MKQSDWSELLETLRELHEAAPNYRLGQLLCNLAMHVDEPDTVSVWDVEDQDLLAAARGFLKSLPDHTMPTVAP